MPDFFSSAFAGHSILSVKDLTSKIKGQLEAAFPYLWVRGQVSNISRPSSGHIYFSLKDADATLAAVWFKGSQQNAERFDPLTGEVYAPAGADAQSDADLLADRIENGMSVVCSGRVTVYPARGAYQLIVDVLREEGQGALHLEFERLKAKLSAEGFFSLERKRPLPPSPKRVAVLTSPGAAALQDFLRLSERRGAGLAIRIHPVPVQGRNAPPAIITALDEVNRMGWAQVIVLIRGGGSLEDLWAFNSEDLARAVFASRIPVLAGIGHEVDFTLADLTADVRAATPSHAAQLLAPERRELAQKIDELETRLTRAWFGASGRKESALAALERALALSSPAHALKMRVERLEEKARRLNAAWEWRLTRLENRLAACRLPDGERLLADHEVKFKLLFVRLESLNPLRPLEQGYSLAIRADGSFLRSVHDAGKGETLNLRLSDGTLPVEVK